MVVYKAAVQLFQEDMFSTVSEGAEVANFWKAHVSLTFNYPEIYHIARMLHRG